MPAHLKSYLKLGIPAVVIVIILALIISSLGKKGQTNQEITQEDLDAGRSYLEALEQINPAQVEETIQYNRQQDMLAYRDTLAQQVESGELDIWSQFTDYVLLGDSRAVGFYYHDFMPEKRVMADGGATIRHLREHIPDIVELQPSNLFLCYGLNDVSIGYWDTPEAYSKEFAEVIQEIKDVLPDVNIYISSILPAQEIAFEVESSWRNIPEYSQAVKEMCEGIKNCCYVDNDDLAEKYQDMYDIDGIHLKKTFYPYWALNMIMEVYNHELDDESNPS